MESVIRMRHTKGMIMIHNVIFCVLQRRVTEGRREESQSFTGYRVDPDMLFYLCGNNNMIYEVYHILRDKGIPDENIFTEVYF